MVRVSLEQHRLMATASLVWSGDLPGQLQPLRGGGRHHPFRMPGLLCAVVPA
jgi:hypothetical protein